jgi:hypothetical protein
MDMRKSLQFLTILVCGCSEGKPIQAPPDLEVSLDTVWVSDSTLEFSSNLHIAPGPDGGVFALDRKQFRVFQLSSSGDSVRTFGSKGEGPGEFTRPYTFGVFRDSLWVIEGLSRRVSLFPLRGGGKVRTSSTTDPVPNKVAGRPLQPVWLMADGSMLMARRVMHGMPNDPAKDTLFLVRGQEYTAVGSSSRSISWPHIGASGSPRAGTQPFLPWDFFAASWDGISTIAVVQSDEHLMREHKFLVRQRNILNNEQWEVAVPYIPRPIEERAIDSVVRRVTGNVATSYRSARDSLLVPAAIAPAGRIVTGTNGELWIGRQDVPGNRFQSVSAHGANPQLFSLPRNFTPHFFSRDSVWGIFKNDLDVPSIALLLMKTNVATSSKAN